MIQFDFEVTQGLRTYAEQDALYAQGRTVPGEIVTNAAAGYSWHNFGNAVDLVPEDITIGQPDWNLVTQLGNGWYLSLNLSGLSQVRSGKEKNWTRRTYR